VEAKDVIKNGNTFLFRFLLLLLLTHFIVVAPTFDLPPKTHAVIADAKNLINNQELELKSRLREEVSPHQHRFTIRAISRKWTQKERLQATEILEKERTKIVQERDSTREQLRKLDSDYLAFDKAKAPREFSIPGVTTIDEHDILKLYPAVLCAGLLRLLFYRRQLMKVTACESPFLFHRLAPSPPLWAAPMPFRVNDVNSRTIIVNLLWTTFLGLAFFLFADVAHREEFYSNSRIFVANALLVIILAGWYIFAYLSAIFKSVQEVE
jgi:hypothetical protein